MMAFKGRCVTATMVMAMTAQNAEYDGDRRSGVGNMHQMRITFGST